MRVRWAIWGSTYTFDFVLDILDFLHKTNDVSYTAGLLAAFLEQAESALLGLVTGLDQVLQRLHDLRGC